MVLPVSCSLSQQTPSRPIFIFLQMTSQGGLILHVTPQHITQITPNHAMDMQVSSVDLIYFYCHLLNTPASQVCQSAYWLAVHFRPGFWNPERGMDTSDTRIRYCTYRTSYLWLCEWIERNGTIKLNKKKENTWQQKKKGPKWRSEKGIREKTKQTGNWTPLKINGEGGVHSAPLESLALPLCNGVYLVCVHHMGGFAVKFAIEA